MALPPVGKGLKICFKRCWRELISSVNVDYERNGRELTVC